MIKLSFKNKIKFFWQRRTCGFDDSETWNLCDGFFDWLEPRLKRFSELTIAYPYDRTYAGWKKELKENHKLLVGLIKCKDDASEYKHKKTKDYKKSMELYGEDYNKFMDWFKDNCWHLWW